MAKYIKKRSKKAGLPPGSLVHIGKINTGEINISITRYNDSEFFIKSVSNFEDCIKLIDKNYNGITWINVDGIHDVELIEKIGNFFGLHSLVMEDIINTSQRPKLEDYDDYLYMVLKIINDNEETPEIELEQISIVLFKNILLTFFEKKGLLLNPLKQRLNNTKLQMKKYGSDYLAYAIIDLVVDSYFLTIEKYGEKIDILEENILKSPSPELMQKVHQVRKDLIFIKNSIWTLREIFTELCRNNSDFFTPTTCIYLRDVYDHTIQIIESIETFRNILSELFDLYLSSISNKMNEIIKVLTIISTIFMPLTFLAGLYGMNFKHMPELDTYWGYPFLLIIMASIAICMLIMFKKKKWI